MLRLAEDSNLLQDNPSRVAARIQNYQKEGGIPRLQIQLHSDREGDK